MESSYLIAIASIFISFVVFGVMIFALFKIDTLEKKVEKKTTDNKARIGRLIRELNIVHDAKRKIDEKQNKKLDLSS